jgi:aminopeptidase N
VRSGEPPVFDVDFIAAMRDVLRHPELDPAFKELVLTLPSEGYVAEQLDVVDPQKIHAAREAMKRSLARELRADWEWAFEAHQVIGGYSPDPVSAGRRALANLSLHMLCLDAVERGDAVWPGRAYPRRSTATRCSSASSG